MAGACNFVEDNNYIWPIIVIMNKMGNMVEKQALSKFFKSTKFATYYIFSVTGKWFSL